MVIKMNNSITYKSGIIIIGNDEIDSFGCHILDSFRELGFNNTEIIKFSPERNPNKFLSKLNLFIYKNIYDYSPKSRKLLFRKKISKIIRKKIDLIITTIDLFNDEEVKFIKNSKIKLVLWYPDHLMNFGRAYFINSDYDAVFFKDKYIVEKLNKIYSINAFYLPQAFSVTKHHSKLEYGKTEFQYDITVIGNMHSFRFGFVKQLQKYGIKIFGRRAPWYLNSEKIIHMHSGKSVENQSKVSTIIKSKISLNTMHFGEINGLNRKAFEIAGAGGFQIIEFNESINEMFIIDKEIVTYNSISELKNKLDFYLKNDELRTQIAKASKLKAFELHTYSHRIRRMLYVLSKKAPYTNDEIYDYRKGGNYEITETQ